LRERIRELAVRHAATGGPVRLRTELVSYGAPPRDLSGWTPVEGVVGEVRIDLHATASDASADSAAG
jgi:hypothetical protein